MVSAAQAVPKGEQSSRQSGDSDDLSSLLDHFPPVSFAFAYGSAVFAQRGYTDSERQAAMTDLVFAVADPCEWHTHNLLRNGSHYSALALLGPGAVAAVQERVGAGLYYNTLIRIGGRLIKYGVISEARLCDDLYHWRTLYVSGRMHKPVRLLRPAPVVQAAAVSNLNSALVAALLLLPAELSEAALFHSVCSLSYSGDVRLRLVEKQKVNDIVDAQVPLLRRLYATPLSKLAGRGLLHCERLPDYGGQLFVQPASKDSRLLLLSQLPYTARALLLYELRPSTASAEQLEQDEQTARLLDAASALWVAGRGDHEANARLAGAMRCTLNRIVRLPSLTQTLKGVLTAGVTRSVQYVLPKLLKQFARARR